MLDNMNVMEIRKYIPLLPPSLLLDYVDEVEPGKYAKGYKCFSYSEPFFLTHFPNDPNVPSAIMIDAMSQIMLMSFLTIPGNEGKITACLKINNVEFKRKIVPGEKLDLFAELKSYRNGLATGHTFGMVNDELTCSADFTIGIPEILEKFRPKEK